jgi:hypothetical protein
LIEGDAANGAGGVAANSRQGQYVVELFRENAGVISDDELSRFL